MIRNSLPYHKRLSRILKILARKSLASTTWLHCRDFTLQFIKIISFSPWQGVELDFIQNAQISFEALLTIATATALRTVLNGYGGLCTFQVAS